MVGVVYAVNGLRKKLVGIFIRFRRRHLKMVDRYDHRGFLCIHFVIDKSIAKRGKMCGRVL